MDRVDRIYQSKMDMLKRKENAWSGKPAPDMMNTPAYRNGTYMMRKALLIKTEIDATDIRLFEDELIAGTSLKTSIYVFQASTFEERLQYTDMHAMMPGMVRDDDEDGVFYKECYTRSTKSIRDDVGMARWNWGHSCGGFERILEMGYLGIAEDAERRIAEMEASGQIDEEKRDFWQAVSMTTRAVVDLATRYAVALEDAAAKETNPERAAELQQMAANMRHVPGRPARTFWEALQSIWLAFMVCARFNGTDIGRFDQYVYPYYQRDVAAGILTEEKATELIEHFFLKCFEVYIISGVGNLGCHPSIMLAGINADGKDGTNLITYMCLHAIERFGTPCPKLSVRINEQTPVEIFKVAHRMLLKGVNQPDFYSDWNILNAYQRIGVPFEDAVKYAQSVCEEVSLAGISEEVTNDGLHIDLHHHVLLAMRRAAKGTAPDTFDGFLAMVDEEIVKSCRTNMDMHDRQTLKIAHFGPQPLHSAAIVGCLESGKDITAGGAKYNNTGSVLAGLACATDSLYTIRRLVYDEKRMTMAEFYAIVRSEYKDHERLRQEILHKLPKYGNDVDDVDQYATHLFGVFQRTLQERKNNRGGTFKVGAWASGHRDWYPAMPDGHLRGEAFATNISPTPGRDLDGVTAILRSATKPDLSLVTGGGMVDVSMSPSCLRGEAGVEILRQLVMSYADMGGIALQFNIADAEVLRQAQEHPDCYQNLMVRVWGYNDYFVALTEERQNHIIARTVQETM